MNHSWRSHLGKSVERTGKEGEGAGHERKEKDRDREANVSAAAVEALGAVAGSLDWTHYRELLNIFMRVMQRNDGKVGFLTESFFFLHV